MAALAPRSLVSPFAFEIGGVLVLHGPDRISASPTAARFGKPTSTLDWNGLWFPQRRNLRPGRPQAERHVRQGPRRPRLDQSGEIIDRDFPGQYKFSDTSSDIKDGKLTFAMFDIGWAYNPVPDIKVGFFAGYHFWRERDGLRRPLQHGLGPRLLVGRRGRGRL